MLAHRADTNICIEIGNHLQRQRLLITLVKCLDQMCMQVDVNKYFYTCVCVHNGK